MVNKSILRCIVLRLERTEQRLFGTENLHGARRVFCKTEQTTRMADKSCANELTDQRSQIGRNRVHTIPQVFCELCAVGGDSDDLLA